jgi:hypothetical protein
MSEIVMSHVKELEHPKLRKVAIRVAKTFYLAAEKTVAHCGDPDNFPFSPTSKSLEHLFLSRFKEFPDSKRSAAIEKLMPFIQGSQEDRFRFYGDLSKVDLSKETEVRQQVREIKFPEALKFQISEIENLIHPETDIVCSGASQKMLKNEKLECRIHEVYCIDETNPEWCGSDDIRLGGSTVDANRVCRKIDHFKVGSFDDGDKKTYKYQGLKFSSFDLLAGTDWPKSYNVIFVLAEEDMGGLGDFINDLVDAVKDEVITAMGSAVGAAVGLVGGPIGAAIGAVIGFVLGKIINIIKSWWSDEIFDPVSISLEIPSMEHRWEEGSPVSPKYAIYFKGHGGEYRLTYNWRLYGTEANQFRSLQSCNYQEHFIRHRNYRGELTVIESATDRKDSTFKIVPGISGRGLSFESLNFPGYYLRHKNFEIWLDRNTDNDLFKKDASFNIRIPGLVGGPLSYLYVSFESLNYPGHYIRHRNFKLYLEKGNDELFRKDASFTLRDGRWWALAP